jgi:addiction module HigA family antidote
MAMKKPTHPGRVVRTMCLEPNGLSVTEAAPGLGVSRQALNNLVNGKAAMSPEMAVRLEKRFGGSAEMWLSLQLAFDLAAAYQRAGTIRVKRKKFLTIPVDPRAHGLTAKTFSRTIAPLFAAKGMLMFVDEQTADVKAAYALKKSITQRPWPGALPPEASYLDAFLDSALDNLLTAFEEA